MFTEIQRAVHEVELRRVYSAPLPTLQSYSLLLGGIQLLHRSTPRDFDLSFRVLGQLAQTHPHALEPRVWQAKWYAMRAVQGQSSDLASDARAALACTGEALAIDPNNAFALAMEGFVHTHLTRDYSTAQERLEGAILQNDSETFAHLFHGVVQGLRGNFASGLASYEVALSTSPQDPARYLMDSIGAYLHLGCGQQEPAIRLARESLRHNRNHAHTWRIITIGQQESGALDEARQSLQRVLELQPDLTVQRYLAGARPGDPVRQRFAEALHRAGLPLH
jgi:adenylate cyclase